MWSDEVDRVLVSAPSGDEVTSSSLDDIRSWRSTCQEVEAKVSFLRRMVQGRLDIVRADQRRRSEGLEPTDLTSLVDQLPQILADRPAGRAATGSGPSPGRLPTSILPPDDEELTAALDAIVDTATLVTLAELPDDDLGLLADRLVGLETEVSRRRQELFACIDGLAAELARRYRTGEATIGASPR